MHSKVFRRWFRKLFRRRFYVAILLVLQIIFLVRLVLNGSRLSLGANLLLTLASTAAVIYIVSKRDKGANKTIWVILILSLPLFGGLLYLLFNFQSSTQKFQRQADKTHRKAAPLYALPGNAIHTLCTPSSPHTAQIRYLAEYAGYPVYQNSHAAYYPSGETLWKAMLQRLETAEHYIFLEYFIIEEGRMWGDILEVLKHKARQGVKVRVLYDDMGCFLTLPHDYVVKLRQEGIECAVFNPFRPFLTTIQNNRDHRKIMVIDGTTAFTGGANLADEYINVIEKHGHWRDTGIRVYGAAAWSFTLMFLEMWELCTKQSEDYFSYYPWTNDSCETVSDGYLQPYADSPLDANNVGEHVYLQIINNAKDYVYISTPYLIVDDSMVSALTLAAKSGVDIRIITPQRWDKWPIHMTTRSYYRELIRAGIKIYEYSGGFNHAKTFVSDDRTATVGTTNLDFRSLYLHFECGVLLLEGSVIQTIKDDFVNTLEHCHQVTEEECTPNLFVRTIQDVLRLFAPLM